jgi:hypothetical protein
MKKGADSSAFFDQAGCDIRFGQPMKSRLTRDVNLSTNS